MKYRFGILFIMMAIMASSVVMAGAAYCDGHKTTSDATFYQNMVFGGRNVAVYKTDSNTPICDYEDFCEREGMNWYAPQSGPEADSTLNAMRAIDNYHTWILSKAPTLISRDGGPSWGGQPLTQIDSPQCVASSTTQFSALRDWGCSFCDPAQYGVSKCWDNSHQYDWIMCEGTYDGGQSGNDVPEFGILAAVGVLGLAGLFLYRKRH